MAANHSVFSLNESSNTLNTKFALRACEIRFTIPTAGPHPGKIVGGAEAKHISHVIAESYGALIEHDLKPIPPGTSPAEKNRLIDETRKNRRPYGPVSPRSVDVIPFT